MRWTVVCAVLLCSTTAAVAQQGAPFPEGPGRDIVAVACTQCHAPGPIVQLRMGEAGWRKAVENMVLRGAQIGPDDLEQVSAYLAASFGPGVPLAGNPPPAVRLAAGPSADLVAAQCGLCHGLDRAVGTRRTPDQWQRIVVRMVDMGAPLDEADRRDVLAYLQANYATK